MLVKIPTTILIEEILSRFDFETLYTILCVNRVLKSCVESQVIPFITKLDLSSLGGVDDTILSYILKRANRVTSLSLNCQRLTDDSLCNFLDHKILELCLCCCSLLSARIWGFIQRECPFLRVLMVEMSDPGRPELFKSNLFHLLCTLQKLECLSLKIRGMEFDANPFESIEFFLPKSIRTLKLKPVLEEDAIHLVNKLGVRGSVVTTDHYSDPTSPLCSGFRIHSLSLVLDVISDRLLVTISSSLPFLVDLELEDRPSTEPSPHFDLTNSGLQSLHSCRYLTSLSLIRCRKHYQCSFKRVNDMGMFLLAESCKGLHSVTLSGFLKVSDAGFAALLHSCQELKKFEVCNASFLSDLAFHDLPGTSCALVEVRLLFCSLVTSEAVSRLTYAGSLEVLDLCGCKSVADSCLSSISHLQKLTKLNLSGADITDAGLSILGQRRVPITTLSLRGCKRVTDRGISFLLHGDGAIVQTLSVLDVGYMPGLTDNGILTIASACKRVTELCIRSCFYVTDSSLRELALAAKIKQLDLYNCSGITTESEKLLRKSSFQGLRWIGIGQTRVTRSVDGIMSKIREERPWLTVCLEGCEIGCRDGWRFHS